jgi:ribosomal-protein-alanine N-acetyltransferase
VSLAGTRIAAYGPEHVEGLLALNVTDRAFFAPWDPVHPDAFFTWAGQAEDVRLAQLQAASDLRHAHVVLDDADPARPVVGMVALSNVVRGAWQNATLGYKIASAANGRGHATAAVRLVLARAFGELGLHRVQAAVRPENAASLRVVAKAGLREEGFAPRYLRIDGAWRDHVLFAVTAEEWT